MGRFAKTATGKTELPRPSSPMILQSGRIVPPLGAPHPFAGRAGVFHPDGRFVHEANVQRGADFEISPRTLDRTPQVRLKGRHLYGGQLNHHFGHFLCESLARLWPLGQPDHGLQSILLLPRRKGSSHELQGFHEAVFGLLGLGIPVRIVDEPMVVEELVIPEQGFGIGPLAAGTPDFIGYIRTHLAPDIAADGPEDLYISREGLALLAGSILGEGALSGNLGPAGYSEFRPEKHDLRSQIAQYRAAKRIVAVEGSALHLYGMVGHPGQKVAIIARRSDHVAADAIAAQIRAFCGAEVEVIDCITREWDVHDEAERSSKSVAEIDFAALGNALAQSGFVPQKTWKQPKVNIERRLDRISGRTGRKLLPCAPSVPR